eukprot:COSAG02_NODE_2768_length_8063_cov_17.175163_3_plen_210_part_00
MSGFGGGLAGLGPNNSFHEPASWVDQKKPPGHTSTSPRTGQKGWWYAWPDHSYVPIGVLGLGLPFVYSPNLVWFVIALAMYVLFPYDMGGGGGLGSVVRRAAHCTESSGKFIVWDARVGRAKIVVPALPAKRSGLLPAGRDGLVRLLAHVPLHVGLGHAQVQRQKRRPLQATPISQHVVLPPRHAAVDCLGACLCAHVRNEEGSLHARR